ncbi:MAG TPA: hypothetical protein VGN89_12620 [Phenylobacterium sp.]|nr:hypothetical protein [Phenylobacterium sp.]
MKGAAGGGATGWRAGAAVVVGGGMSTGAGGGSATAAGAGDSGRGLEWVPGLEAANLVGGTGDGAAIGDGAVTVTGRVAAGAAGAAPPTIWPAAREGFVAAGAGAWECPNPISKKIAAVPPAPTATAAISGVTRTSPRVGLPRVAWARRAPRSPMGMISGGASRAAIGAGAGAASGSGNGSGAGAGGAAAKGVGSGSGCATEAAADSGSGRDCGANESVSATTGASSGSGSGCATGAACGDGVL